MNDLELLGVCYNIANLSDRELHEQQKLCMIHPYETIVVKCFGVKIRIALKVYEMAIKLEADKRGI